MFVAIVSYRGESPDAQMGLTSGEEGGDGGVLVHNYTKVEGDRPVMVESLLVLEGGDVNPKDVELSSAPILFEGISRQDKKDQHEVFERGEFLESRAVLLLVVVESGNLVSDLVSVFVHLVDIVGESGILREEVDDELEGVGLKGVL